MNGKTKKKNQAEKRDSVKPTVSIGIAAYNEARNIRTLLASLLAQQIDSAVLKEILVVSDGSTDTTDDIVRSFQGKVRLIRFPKRSGTTRAQNTIMEQATGDMLALVDADILPQDAYFIEHLISPLLADPSVGLTSGLLVPASPQTFIENVLARMHEFKTELFISIGDGNNLYTCVGPARCFSRALYAKIRLPDNHPSDAASYMLCIANGMRFVLARSARALFRTPSNVRDHVKQGSRFLAGEKAIVNTFGEAGERAYEIPRLKFLKAMMRECAVHPILFGSYVALSLYIRSRRAKPFTSAWDMATSSKKI